MDKICLFYADISPINLTFFLIFFSLIFMAIAFFCGLNWYLSRLRPSLCPYTGIYLRYATDLSLYNAEKVLRFLYELKQYDNRIFSLKKAAFCRDTGRIFTNSVNFFGTIKVDWSFISQRYPGVYVSWGSLSVEQQREITELHGSLTGFQTVYSCPNPSPAAITEDYAYTKPGPLYVDLETKVVVGWKCVPDVELEVLIVQKPIDREALLPKITDINNTKENNE